MFFLWKNKENTNILVEKCVLYEAMINFKDAFLRSVDSSLTLSTLGKNFCRQHFEIFFLFFPETGFDISFKLSPLETVCMKC